MLNHCPISRPATHPPATVATSVNAPPIRDASMTRPLRILYMYSPTNSAIGIVQAIVNVPHAEPGTRRTAPGGSAALPSAHCIGVADCKSNFSLISIDDLPPFHVSVVP